MFSDLFGNFNAELVAGYSLWHVLYNTCYCFHGVAPVAVENTISPVCFRCGAVNNGNKIVSDDDSVLAFCLWGFRFLLLFYNLHVNYDCYYMDYMLNRKV